ncbi:ABC transporter [Thermococcus guaymasensis DSM 11113]|uniref:ABC transporter n=1 Tax=Thermococcus guaymasensis DSM 11113 TaxID=1432656 RepID=A0A0X1KMS2_9EURY|nr:ABC transporter permease [Thermococcus guaymasensis]AJC72554.1 ABC transporter [Thermococcus guaymasensis DSM 11113]
MSSLFDLFLKEIKLIARRRSVLFFLIFIPLFFGVVSSSYKEAIPEDTPMAIVIEGNVSQDDVSAIMQIARTFSHPYLVSDLDAALKGLQREEYYVVIEVKHFESLENGEYVVYYDRSMNPVASISENLLRVLRVELRSAGISSTGINEKISLPTFFLPGVLLLISMIIGFELVADNCIAEKQVFPRLRLLGVLGRNIALRIVVMLLLVFIQSLIILVVYEAMGVEAFLNVKVLLILLLNTLFFSLLGLFVTMLLRFEAHAKTFLHVLMGFVIFISGLFYPVGFFPEALQRVARLIPTYYSAILMRSFMFRPVEMSLYSDYILINVVSVAVLIVGIITLHRRALKWIMQ